MSTPARSTRPPLRPELISLLWTTPLWALPFAIFFQLVGNAPWREFGHFFAVALLFTFVIRTALLAAGRLVLPRLRGAPPGTQAVWAWPGIVYTLAALLGTYASTLLVDLFLWHRFVDSPRGWLVSGLYGLLFSLTIGGIAYARVYYRVALERAGHIERIRAELARAELRALRAQIHPHFLFNTLNTISALILEDPRRAEDVLTRLAEMFRFTLAATGREHTPLREELEFLRSYLEIESARMGPRLAWTVAAEPGLDDARVPSLLLQPLVENAVRWGAGARPEGGHVHVRAARRGDALEITIADDGPGFSPGGAPGGSGVGLESVRERLRLAGPGHRLEIAALPQGGTLVTVGLAIEPATALQPPDEENRACSSSDSR